MFLKDIGLFDSTKDNENSNPMFTTTDEELCTITAMDTVLPTKRANVEFTIGFDVYTETYLSHGLIQHITIYYRRIDQDD